MSRTNPNPFVWLNANESKPRQGERVLLVIEYEECPVVGYWGEARWEACCVNHEIFDTDPYSSGGGVTGNFDSEMVTHYMHISLPE